MPVIRENIADRIQTIMKILIVAMIGVVGVVVGALLNAGSEFLKLHLLTTKQDKLDMARKKFLKSMLDNPQWPWRKLETLKHCIGADEPTTIRLLIELDARASENDPTAWGLISRNPFPDRQ
jgi:hypothetical protein